LVIIEIIRSKMKSTEFKKIWDAEWRIFARNSYLRVNRRVVEAILGVMGGEVKGKKILEVGAGCGGDSVFLAKKEAICTVLDISPEAIKVAQKIAKTEKVKITGIVADCQQIPEKNNFYDLVFSVGLVEHFRDPLPIIKEQLRVLKKDGFLIIDVPQEYNIYTLIKHLRMKFGRHPFGWETEYSTTDLKRLAQALNIKATRFYGRDTALRLRLPLILREPWLKIFSIVEKSKIAPFVCLNIGMIYIIKMKMILQKKK